MQEGADQTAHRRGVQISPAQAAHFQPEDQSSAIWLFSGKRRRTMMVPHL